MSEIPLSKQKTNIHIKVAPKQESAAMTTSRQSTQSTIELRKSVVSVSSVRFETSSQGSSAPPSVEKVEEEYNPQLNAVKKTLFAAARKCDSATLTQTIADYKTLNLNFVDESGKTLLHHCANAGNKNDVALLLSRGIPVNKIDNLGQSALHYVAKKDYADIVEMLVVHGASLDLPDDKTGQTALHMAVTKNHTTTVEFLLFSGSSVMVKDKSGRIPEFFCRSKEMRNILATAANTSTSAGRARQLRLQTVVVQGGGVTECTKLGIIVDYSSGPADDKFSLMCRRQAPDDSYVQFQLHDTDEMFGDVFQYRLGRKGKATPVRLTIPIFAAPGPVDQLILVTEKAHRFPVEKTKKGTEEMLCEVVVDISLFDSFVIVSQPHHDCFEVTQEGGTFKSKINNKIILHVPPKAVNAPTKMFLELLETPNSSVFDTKALQDLYSSTPFCSVHAANKDALVQDVKLELPIPEEYGVGKNLMIFTADVEESSKIRENSWSVSDISRNITNESVTYDVKSTAMKVVIETKSGANVAGLPKQVSTLFQKSRKKEFAIVFIAMTKHDNVSGVCKIIIECNIMDNLEKAKKQWISDGFKDQKPSQTPSFNGYSRQKYRLTLSKNMTRDDEDGEFILQFQPKRHNFIIITKYIPKNAPLVNGHVTIAETDGRKKLPEEEVQTETVLDKVLTSIPIKMGFDPPPAPSATAKVVQNAVLDAKENARPLSNRQIPKPPTVDPTQTGFTNDRFLQVIVDELDEQWYKIIIMMGWSFAEVEKLLLDSKGGGQKEKIMHFLLQWRDMSKARDDLGMPSLLTAFAKGGRRDLCTTVQLLMKEWKDDEKNQKSKFWRWIQKAFKDSDLINPGDYPKPMSDQFLLLLVEVIGFEIDLGFQIGLSKLELDVMKSDKAMDNDLKMLKLLVSARDVIMNQLDSLKKLLDSMMACNMMEGVRWVMIASRQWVEAKKDTGTTPFSNELEELLEVYDKRITLDTAARTS